MLLSISRDILSYTGEFYKYFNHEKSMKEINTNGGKQSMNKDEINKVQKELDSYINTYYDKISKNNAWQAIKDFNENWCIINEGQHILNYTGYGNALSIFSYANSEIDDLTEMQVSNLSDLINKYEKNLKDQGTACEIKEILFLNLGLCWHKLGKLYDNKAIETFKKYLYYLISISSDTKYCPTAYAFKKCNEFIYQSLINNQLGISSPTTFNDPFDCPIRILTALNNEDDISSLVIQAYNDCLKIACFTSNWKLPKNGEWDSIKKHEEDKEEFLNELMWAHYADSHKGICIKYKFDELISKSRGEDENIVSYFTDVEYSDEDLNSYSKKDSISSENAFFLKGKKWEYENELRFLYFDLEGKGERGTIDIPNCIEAIYFGLKCSEPDKADIKNIMKTKNTKIKFYKMELDEQHFGQLKAKEIQ